MVAIPLRREALLKTTRKIANLGNKNFNVLCPHWKNEKFTLTEIFFRQINSSDLFSICIAFTKFLPKKHESKFP